MKRIAFNLLGGVLLFLTLVSCQKENEEKTESNVEFSFEIGGKLKSINADSISAIVVSIENLSGRVIYNTESVPVYNMNGYYISKPLSLVPGGYRLTQFMVIDLAGNVIYITPMEGSPKAHLVNDPLPISFAVSKNDVTKVVPQVINAKGGRPQDFGYATFSFEKVATFDFLIGVFAYNESTQNFEMTTAHLSVAADSGWVYAKDIPAATDTITVKDNQTRYILTVTKDGYETYVDTMSESELKLYYSSEDNGPLKVVLFKSTNKKITFRTNQDTLRTLNIGIRGLMETNVIIDWGDGHFENITFNSNIVLWYKHNYENRAIYNVIIGGNSDKITDLYLFNNNNIESLDISEASELQVLYADRNKLNSIDVTNNLNLRILSLWQNNLSSLDITNNIKLESVYIGSDNITSIDLSKQAELKDFGARYGKLSFLDLSNNKKLRNLTCFGNKDLKELNLSNNKELYFVQCFGNNLNKLEIGQNESIQTLECMENPLGVLDITQCPNLQRLICYRNNLNSINISTTSKLQVLNCAWNNLTTLDISNNPELVNFTCAYNRLTSLDISSNKKFTYLSVSFNLLSSSSINKIISDLLASVAENPRAGDLSAMFNNPPTGQGINDKDTLINKYGWNVYVDE